MSYDPSKVRIRNFCMEGEGNLWKKIQSMYIVHILKKLLSPKNLKIYKNKEF